MSLYDQKTSSLGGEAADLSEFKGKVTLVVNVASACGFTPQYKGLQALHEELSAKGFAVLGFPCNQFGAQEPGSAEEILNFCETKFAVKFPMFEKVEVKPGGNQSPVYAFLTAGGDVPNWNFCKYLVGKDGEVIKFYPSNIAPSDKGLRADIEAALSA